MDYVGGPGQAWSCHPILVIISRINVLSSEMLHLWHKRQLQHQTKREPGQFQFPSDPTLSVTCHLKHRQRL